MLIVELCPSAATIKIEHKLPITYNDSFSVDKKHCANY